ncbi:unnamed protein product, partial [Rotaria sp. Silwood1]
MLSRHKRYWIPMRTFDYKALAEH